MRLQHIKQWYEVNKSKTPLTLRCENIYYFNFNKTFLGHLRSIDANIKTYGAVKCKSMRGVMSAINSLEDMILHVEYLGEWNAEPVELNKFKKITEVPERKINHHVQKHIDILNSFGIITDLKNKSLAYTSKSRPSECKKSVDFFKQKGYLSQRSTI